jgi:hypothetical protein
MSFQVVQHSIHSTIADGPGHGFVSVCHYIVMLASLGEEPPTPIVLTMLHFSVTPAQSSLMKISADMVS